MTEDETEAASSPLAQPASAGEEREVIDSPPRGAQLATSGQAEVSGTPEAIQKRRRMVRRFLGEARLHV